MYLLYSENISKHVRALPLLIEKIQTVRKRSQKVFSTREDIYIHLKAMKLIF